MDPKLVELFKAATEKSRAGTLKWLPVGPSSFRVKIGRGNLHVHRTEVDPEPGTDSGVRVIYLAQVSDHLGNTVAEAEEPESRGVPPAMLQDLYTAARSSALGGNELIESMLGSLKIAM